jgi:hypothetical protein
VVQPFRPEPPTGPTVALASRSLSTREVYRLFLAGEYVPALALASDLIAGGDEDPMLATIVRECRSSLLNQSAEEGVILPTATVRHSNAPEESANDASSAPPRVHGKMTLEQVAAMTGAPLDQVIQLLESFVTLAALTPR